ncbi:collagenase [Papilio machaon]|uniref:collagenase n=1 Tax=Papilio machaon TaxID=76193 RepID=UPI001E664452|nr:collagenase [Papilio machaon]
MGPLLFALCLLGGAAARQPVALPWDNYHESVGIPLASRIKETEDAWMSGDSVGSRIVGGAAAPVNGFPYLAGLLITFWNHAGTSACGASLLSSNRLVTAAHCWFHSLQANQFTVVLGSQYLFYGGTRVTTTNVIMHPQYVPRTLLNDVAMILLPTNVFLSNSIQPIALPDSNELWNQFNGQWAVAAGYGKTNDQQAGVSVNSFVSHVTLQVITVWQCQSVFGSTAQPSNICTSGAGGVGICGGDSGGPLVVNHNGRDILIGISSFVASNGCQLGFPSGFARVTSFYNFIMQYM